MTQAAISRMVRLLEARLGIRAVRAAPDGLVLTAQAEALKPSLTAAFNSIAASVEQVVAMRTTPVLTIGVGPSFAMRWMIPRLASFYGTHPDIEVRLATGGAIDPFKDDWTCGILLGNGDWPGLAAEPCFRPICFPSAPPRSRSALASRRISSTRACCRSCIRRRTGRYGWPQPV